MSRERMPLTAAGCMGKLRAFGDFVRLNAASEIVEELDVWFQEGITLSAQVLGRGWEAAFDAAPPASLLFRPAGSRRLLAGAWTPSIDRTGRRYPFLVFTEADGSGAVTLAASPFLRAARNLALEARDAREARHPFPELGKLPVDGVSLELARASYEGFIGRTTAGEFWAELLESFESPVRRIIISNLAEACETWSRGGGGHPGFGIKLPLPRDEGERTSLHAAIWLDLAGRLLGKREAPSVVYWNETAAGGFFLFTGPPHARDFLPLLQPGEERESVWDLSRASSGPAPRLPASIDPEALEDPALLLDNWLTKIVRT